MTTNTTLAFAMTRARIEGLRVGVSESVVGMIQNNSGGIILLRIALKMIVADIHDTSGQAPEGEASVMPLAAGS